ncbi:MAG TPA: hypothetical protein VG106_11060 [Vicinamibacterales bacterium]|nr:hypothetical protein [Vicinamibacterales bacterium]
MTTAVLDGIVPQRPEIETQYEVVAVNGGVENVFDGPEARRKVRLSGSSSYQS